MLKRMLKGGFKFIPKFRFSSDYERITQASIKLRGIIQKEHKYEHMNYKRDEQIQISIQDAGFQEFDDENSNYVELYKKFPKAEVRIIFCGTPPLPGQLDDKQKEIDNQSYDQLNQIEKQQYNENMDSKKIEKLEYSVDFTVLIAFQEQTIIYECTSSDSQVLTFDQYQIIKITINFVSYGQDVNYYRRRSKLDKFIRDYSGPSISTIDERLQASFRDYLFSFGIDSKIAAVIEALSLDKEQRSYMKLLKQLDQFLS